MNLGNDVPELKKPEVTEGGEDTPDETTPETEGIDPKEVEEDPADIVDTQEDQPTESGDEVRGSDQNVTSKTRDVLSKQRRVKIKIPSTEREKDDVSVGINGHVFLIKRDEFVEVPVAVIEVLNNAKMTVYTQKKREDGEGYELVPAEAQRFPYQSEV